MIVLSPSKIWNCVNEIVSRPIMAIANGNIIKYPEQYQDEM